MYLIIQDRGTGTVLHTQRLQSVMNWPAIRQALEELFPGGTLYSPLEPMAPGARVVITYGSRTKDGKSRCTAFDMWAVQEAKPFELTAEEQTW